MQGSVSLPCCYGAGANARQRRLLASHPALGSRSRSGGLRMRTLIPVLCTSGLAAEARVARAAGFQVIVGGGDPGRTEALVEAAAQQAKCLVSFGVAAGLAPHLQPGNVILSAAVLGHDRLWLARETRQALMALAGPARALRLAFHTL